LHRGTSVPGVPVPDRWPLLCRLLAAPAAESRRLVALLAVDQKVEQIVEFVRWWDEGVGVRQHANSEDNADRRSPLSKSDAEQITGITQQQVSRWRKRIKDEA